MTTKNLQFLLLKLRLLAMLLIAGLLLLLTLSFRASEQLGDDVWKQLGMTKDQGSESIRRSFLQGYLNYYQARNLRHIAEGDRLAVARDLLDYSRQFVSSQQFKNEYAQQRRQAMPQMPDTVVRSKEAIRASELAKTKESIASLEESMKKMTPDVQKSLQPSLDLQKKNLVDYQKPDNEMIDMMYQVEKSQAEFRKQSYQEELEQWKKNFPEDYRLIVKKRLQEFLDLSATVDFNAELKDSGGKKRFVNPAYEAKPSAWKQVFRAGKPVTEMTRQFAQTWIKDLSK